MRQARGRARPVRALGMMSGTSLDGVDAAVVVTDGERIVAFGETGFRTYSDAERTTLRAALGRWPGDSGVEAAAAVVEAAHAELAGRFDGVELVGFHGQTLAHDPAGAGTHQAGSGARLAEALGLPVVWDFRTADVALGGQGAPLAPFFHHAAARWAGLEGPVAFLNIGGVANVSFVQPGIADPAAPGALLAFDTGPGGALMDDEMLRRRGVAMDRGGALAAAGRPDEGIVARALADPYFLRMPPKSLDRDHFAWLAEAVRPLPDADALATLAAVTVLAVEAAASHAPAPVARWLLCGGGRKNEFLVKSLQAVLEAPVEPCEAVGLDGDMLEAQAFAHLAVRVARGLPTSAPGTTGVRAAICGGQISRPG